MVYSPPRPSSSSKRKLELASPASPDDDDGDHATTRTPPPRQQIFEESPSFVHSSHSRHEANGTTFRQQQQQQQQRNATITSSSRSPAAWVNASLNPQRKKSPATTSNSSSSTTTAGYRRLGPSGSSTSLKKTSTQNNNNNSQQRKENSTAASSTTHRVSLVPSAAEMVAIKRIAAQEAANPANPSSNIPAFGHSGHRSDPYSKKSGGRNAASSPVSLIKSGRYGVSRQNMMQQKQQQPQTGNNTPKKNTVNSSNQHLNVSRSVRYDDDDNNDNNDENEEEEEEEEEEDDDDEEYQREYEEKIREAREKEARFAAVNRQHAARKDAGKNIGTYLSPSRLNSQGNEQQQQQHVKNNNSNNSSFLQTSKKRPTYVVLGEGGKVEDVVPNSEKTRTVHQDRRHFDPRYREYEVEDDNQDDDDDNQQRRRNNKRNKKNKTTYVVTRGYSYDIEEEERAALEEAREEHQRRTRDRGPLFSPVLPGYPKQEELELKIDESNKDNEAIKVMEKQFKELQKQLMETNKQMVDVSEERLRVLARTLADAEDMIKEERKQNELLRAELATSQQSFETLQTTLSSERAHWVQDRDAIRKEHQEHIKALEQDWTIKIEKANNEIAKFLTSQEFEREQHNQQIHQMRRRQKDLEAEVRDLQTEVAIHIEGAKRAAKIVEEERKEADDRIVAAHARADGVEFIHQTEEGKLKAQVKDLQIKLEASMKREEQLEGDLYQMMRRVEDGKSSSDIYQRKYEDVTSALQSELERNRTLTGQVDELKSDLAQSEGEKEARRILERQNDELERQLSDMRRTVSQLMKIAQQ